MENWVTIVGWGMALIFVYLVVSNGQTAYNLFSSATYFVGSETKTLQGR